MSHAHRMLLLAHAAAGSVEHDRARTIRDAIAELTSAPVELCTPDSPGNYAEAVASAAGADIVILGGDGSIHQLLQEVHDQDLLAQIGPISVIPLGTGNDLARGAGVPLDTQEAIRVATSGRPTARSLLLDDAQSVVVNVVHAGVAAEATARASTAKGLLGRIGYAVGAVRAGVTVPGRQLRVEVDGVQVCDGTRPVLMVTAALGRSIGGGAPVAPQSMSTDHLVDVLVAYDSSMAARVGFARDLRTGRHTERDDVVVTRGREVLVQAVAAADAFRTNADGEVSEELPSRRWRLLPEVWQLRVPRSG